MLGSLSVQFGADADAESWLFTPWSTVGWIVVSAVLMLAAVILVVRITGLRSLAKMSSFDFAVTVAIGSILGSVGRRWDRTWSTTRRSCWSVTGSSSRKP